MTVLIILENKSGIAEAARYWKARVSPEDHVCFINLRGSKLERTGGCDSHYLVPDPAKSFSFGARITRAAGRRLSSIYPFWNLILLDTWQEFIWQIRAFDPDTIDLRWMRDAQTLQRALINPNWRIICSDEDAAMTDNPDIPRPNPDSTPKVSIVLPIYNGEPFLRQSIDSCLQQTYRNIELVIVDDCSRDNTASIIADYAMRDLRVKTVRNAKNLRLPNSLNVGFGLATGGLLTWTSHDNYYVPDAIERLVRHLSRWKDVDFVYSAFRLIEISGTVQEAIHYRLPPWLMPHENVVGACFLYHRRVYERIGDFRAAMEYVEDYDYWVRVYKSGYKMMPLHESLYYYRHHPESMTTRAQEMEEKPWDKVRREYYQN